MADGDRIGKFALTTSRRTGLKYWAHSDTSKSFWYDERLPHGWAFGKDGENAPKYYVNLYTGDRMNDIPTAPARDPAADNSSRKRPRPQDEEASAPTASTNQPIASGTICPGLPEPRFPRVWETGPDGKQQIIAACCFGFVDHKPSEGRYIDTRFFDDTHALVLRQLVTSALRRHASILTNTRKWLLESGRSIDDADDEVGRMAIILHDCGAGTGAVTDFFLRAVAEIAPGEGFGSAPSSDPSAAPPEPTSSAASAGTGAGTGKQPTVRLPPVEVEVYAQDCWDISKDYYADQLAYYSHGDLSASWRGDGRCSSFTQFCANFWLHEPDTVDEGTGQVVKDTAGYGDPRVIPARFPMPNGVQQMSHMGLAPAISYLHADLGAVQLRACLDAMWSKWMDPELIGQPNAPRVPTYAAGGGWDLSEDVRKTVLSFAHEHGLSVHVEQGKCWTFCRDIVKETRNTGADALALLSETQAASGAASVAAVNQLKMGEEGDVLRSAAVKVWQAGVMAVIEDGRSTCEELREAIGSHGKGKRAASSASSASGGAVAEFEGEPWLEEGGDDKFHLTPLMRACKAGRADLVKALVEEHGANVNTQASRSLYTALHMAAHGGHEGIVVYLLQQGRANPTLINKFGEDPSQAAAQRKGAVYTSIVAKLQAAIASWKR